MNRHLGLFCSLMLVTACGPEAEPTVLPAPEASGLSTQSSALASPPVITFWSGNGCVSNQVGWYTYPGGAIIMPNSTGSGWVNDEARSLMLFRAPQGLIIRVYDSPSGAHNDDWAEITIKQYADQLCIPSFEDVMDNAAYSLRFCRHNGLDGKVSQARAQDYAFSGSTCNGTWIPW
ncbi:hypothetical protein [Melittangium boletus]|uniref:hypothetical protein n=1 Tax=Melittangium boletus TaxID=83453 RepID=UPI003DA36ADD